ncbi:MAG: S1C family serine protease [Trueperaceae bacterium]
MNDEPGTAPHPSDFAAQPGPNAEQAPVAARAAEGSSTLELVHVSATPHQRGRIRVYTWLLLFLLAITAVLGTQVRRPVTYQHVSDSPPPIEAPTGALLSAYEVAREATVRIEARHGHWNGPVIGVGTGFFVSQDGMLLTAYHVVDPNNTKARTVRYVAVTSDSQVYRLEMVGFDAYLDLAALQANVTGPVPYLQLADRSPNTGTPVVAIGNSRDEFLAARAGRVTRLGVQASRADFADDTMELTNSLAPGDSGGPVVNSRAEVVGVVSFISFNPTAMNTQSLLPPVLQGLGLVRDFASYAVPLTIGSEAVAAVVAGEVRDWPVIGFSWAQNDYNPGQSRYDLGPRPGPVVDVVAPGGPADLAGLRSRAQETVTNPDGSSSVLPLVDVIVAFDGVPTPTFYDLLAQVKSRNIGDVVTLTVQRGSATYRLELELGTKNTVFLGG